MNKLRSLKHRSNNVLNIGGSTQSELAIGPTNNATNSSGNMLTKLSKRYANVKFMRQHPGRTNPHAGLNGQPAVVASGSYDLTTAELKREIGAPILISKTCIDMDTTDCRIPPNSVGTAAAPAESVTSSDEDATHCGEYTVNAIDNNESVVLGPPKGSSTVLRKNRSKSASNLHKSELRFVLQRAPSLVHETNNNGEMTESQHRQYMSTSLHPERTYTVTTRPLRYSTEHPDCHYEDVDVAVGAMVDGTIAEAITTVGQQHQQSYNRRKSSVSTSSSNASSTPPALPLQPPPPKPDRCSAGSCIDVRQRDASSSREHSFCRDSLASDRSTYEGADNYQIQAVFNPFDVDVEANAAGSMYQTLDARELFRSIEELNAITRQLNEEDDIDEVVDHRNVSNDNEGGRNNDDEVVDKEDNDDIRADDIREYCEHRDRLRPDQRRITLLRNKGSSVLNLNVRREKLGNAWSGLKQWIGEEGGRMKEVMNKHAAMQRVGAGQLLQQQQQHSLETATDADEGPTPPTTPAADSSPNGAGAFLQTLVRKGSKQSQASRASKRTDVDGGGGGGIAEGQNGFEELRRYVKQGGDFGKELAAILQERVDSEQLYAKSLSKMATKLNKACRDIPGSLADGWRGVATEMEGRSEMHRMFSSSLVDDIVKPLRTMIENQHKTRKAIETAVEKTARVLAEWRCTEAKAKKTSHTAARENEKIQDAMLDVRIQRSPSVVMLHRQISQPISAKSPDREQKIVDKDCAKLDNKRRKAEELVKRADVEYYTLCIRAERARVEWELSVLRGSTILQSHENQRLAGLKTHLADYLRFTQLMNPGTTQLCEQLTPAVAASNVHKDLQVVANIRRASEGPSEQLLPDFYCEHTTLAMNRERRKHALVKLLQLVRTDLERERKSRTGLQVIAHSLNTPDNQNVVDKLYHIRSMLTYLEGARFKLQSGLLELDHKPRGSHPLANHIQITRDRTGLQQSILKTPLWLRNGDDSDRQNAAAGSGTDTDLLTVLNNNSNNNMNGNISDHEVDSSVGDVDEHLNDQRQFNLYNIRNGGHSDGLASSGAATMPATTVLVKSAARNGGTGERTKHHSRRSDSPTTFDRGQADGGSNQPDSDFDDFSSQDEDDELGGNKQRHSKMPTQTTTTASQSDLTSNGQAASAQPAVISRCRAIYSYEPKLYDELELSPGDLIEVHAKQEDGWWLGALSNNHNNNNNNSIRQTGIFPATYVEELSD